MSTDTPTQSDGSQSLSYIAALSSIPRGRLFFFGFLLLAGIFYLTTSAIVAGTPSTGSVAQSFSVFNIALALILIGVAGLGFLGHFTTVACNAQTSSAKQN
jgi:hypothetical protein